MWKSILQSIVLIVVTFLLDTQMYYTCGLPVNWIVPVGVLFTHCSSSTITTYIHGNRIMFTFQYNDLLHALPEDSTCKKHCAKIVLELLIYRKNSVFQL